MLHHHERIDPDADATLRAESGALKAVLTGSAVLAEQVEAGAVHIDGDASALERLSGLLDDFRTWFNIVEP